ncbi:MAG: MdtA/MuxA family multidrug efflux RND transporter periplasmic adaptor subunit [Acidobacteriaceae bacterium]|nr:MdtA/MuxA family multidrug efflux RND transporter periplasmic adaptor subunit [Acidobacteriaceae bacterium]
MTDPHSPTALETPAPARPAERPKVAPPGTPPPPSKPRRAVWLWIVLLLLLAGGAYYYFENSRKQPAQPAAQVDTGTPGPGGGGGGRHGRGMGTIPVVAVKSTRGDIGVYYVGIGSVTPIYTVTVKTRVDGQLLSIHYKEGDMVQKGDLLAEIDPRPYQAQLLQYEGQLMRDQASLANAKVDQSRYETLLKQNAVPEQQLATQKATVQQDEGVVKTDQGLIDAVKVNLDYCRITAPISGRVGLRLVDPGNIVHASDGNGLIVITQLQPISVIFTVAEDQIDTVLAKLRGGQHLPVDAFDREMKNKISSGTLTTTDNIIDQSTGTLKLRATFNNPRAELFPNQFVNARLLVEQKHGVVLLPTAAIQRNTQMTYVWMIKPDSSVAVQQVYLGVTEGDHTEITSGLKPGDTVVMTGVDKLQNGTKVTAHFAGENPANTPPGPGGAGANQQGTGKRKRSNP